MKNKAFQTFDEAVADIPDGSTIMFPGFGGVGTPQNLITALHGQGARSLTGISNGHGGTDGRVDVGRPPMKKVLTSSETRRTQGSSSNN